MLVGNLMSHTAKEHR